jgi:hypothetical protein
MFSFGSNVKSADVLVEPAAWQVPTKVPVWLPDVVQFSKPPSGMLTSSNDGPESKTSLGSVGEDPGSILICRSQFSSFHDWYCLGAPEHVDVSLRGVCVSLVVMSMFGRAPVLVVLGTQ